MKQILRKLYDSGSRIIYITLGNTQYYQSKLISLSLIGLFVLLIEVMILFGIFSILILSLWFGCAITDSCYAVHDVAVTSSEWGSNQ